MSGRTSRMSVRVRRLRSLAAASVLGLLVAGCGGSGGDAGSDATAGPVEPVVAPAAVSGGLSTKAAVGAEIFLDAGLSSSGQQSCATCHSPSRSFIAITDIPLGGPTLSIQGVRQAPTLSYLAWNPAFGRDGRGGAWGGYMLDGRSPTLADQAHFPLLAPFEMDNADAAALLARVRTRSWFTRFTDAFGEPAGSDPAVALAAVGKAVELYQQESGIFRAFSSKYDYVQSGTVQFTDRERNGQRLFEDPAKGNCASCHATTATAERHALFTDHRYYALGVPRNWSIQWNRDGVTLPAWIGGANGTGLGAPGHAFYDMGLCGPFRADNQVDGGDCGKFRTPTLRNAALKTSYFHNGLKWTIQQVIRFKTTRDATPSAWYLQADGVTPDQRYNDLPAIHRGNVVQQPPFAGKGDGTGTLTDGEVNDLTLFLCALIDGFQPNGTPTAQLRPGQQCVDALAAPGGV